jgi:serine protease Do
MRFTIPFSATLIALAFGVRAASAEAQAVLALNQGFSPDPTIVRAIAGGPLDGSRFSADCRGNFPTRPQHRIVTNGLPSVRMFTMADGNADVTLAVVSANGSAVFCDDDRGGSNQAMLDLRLGAGAYDVFVGTFNAGAQPAYGLVVTTDLSLTPDTMQSARPRPQSNNTNSSTSPWNNPNTGTPTPPQYNRPIDRAATMRPTGALVRLGRNGGGVARGRTGGNQMANAIHSGCTGFTNLAPSHAVQIPTAGFTAVFGVRSAADTTLMIRAPNGEVRCNDDANGGFNPEVIFEQTVPGTYTVWVGTYRAGLRNLYQLSVSLQAR